MAQLLHLDAFSGAAGNMFMAALLDLGLSRKALLEGLAPLGLDFKLVVKKVERNGFASRYVDVRVPVPERVRRAEARAHAGGSSAAGHSHSHRHGAATHAHGRHYAEIRDRMFAPYFTTKENGSGLGLAIVNRIVLDHNGRIRVEDLQPKGSRFVVELPA